MNTLLLHLDSQGQLARWHVFDEGGQLLEWQASEDFSSLPVMEKADRLVVALAGEVVSVLMALPPAKMRERHYAKAIPFLLEDQLSQPIEMLSFIPGEKEEDGQLPVAVLEKQTLSACLDELARHDLSPEVVLPAYLLLPYEPGRWTFLVEANQVLLRSGYQNGAVIDLDTAKLFIESMLEHEPNLPASLYLVNIEQSFSVSDSQALITHLQAAPEAAEKNKFAINELIDTPAINVLPGKLQSRKKKKSSTGSLFGSWRLVVGLSVLWVVAIFVGEGVEHFRLSKQLQQTSVAVSQLYQKILPNEQGGNPQQMIQAALKKMQKTKISNLFMITLTKAANVLATEPEIKMLGIGYQNNVLTIVFAVNHQEALQRISSKMSAKGLNATQKVQEQTATGIIGSIQVKGSAT